MEVAKRHPPEPAAWFYGGGWRAVPLSMALPAGQGTYPGGR